VVCAEDEEVTMIDPLQFKLEYGRMGDKLEQLPRQELETAAKTPARCSETGACRRNIRTCRDRFPSSRISLALSRHSGEIERHRAYG
jgi:hypothetical protein